MSTASPLTPEAQALRTVFQQIPADKRHKIKLALLSKLANKLSQLRNVLHLQANPFERDDESVAKLLVEASQRLDRQPSEAVALLTAALQLFRQLLMDIGGVGERDIIATMPTEPTQIPTVSEAPRYQYRAMQRVAEHLDAVADQPIHTPRYRQNTQTAEQTPTDQIQVLRHRGKVQVLWNGQTYDHMPSFSDVQSAAIAQPQGPHLVGSTLFSSFCVRLPSGALFDHNGQPLP